MKIQRTSFFSGIATYSNNTKSSTAVQAAQFLGVNDDLVRHIASASLEDALILAGGSTDGRSDWREKRHEAWCFFVVFSRMVLGSFLENINDGNTLDKMWQETRIDRLAERIWSPTMLQGTFAAGPGSKGRESCVVPAFSAKKKVQ